MWCVDLFSQRNKPITRLGGGGGIGVCVWVGGDFYLAVPSPPRPQTFFKGFIKKWIFLNISLEEAAFEYWMHFLPRLGPGRRYREDLHEIGG